MIRRPKNDVVESNERAEGTEESKVVVQVREIIRNLVLEGVKPEDLKRIEGEMQNFSMRIKVSACETPKDFLNLFRLLRIPDDKWQNSRWLIDNGYENTYRIIRGDPRFKTGGWDSFTNFMLESEIFDSSILLHKPSKQVFLCKKSRDFRKLFQLLRIPDEKWRSSTWLKRNGHANLYRAIIYDPRFKEGGWDSFKEFMLGPIVLDESILLRKPSQQVSACKTPSDFRKLFRLLGIPNEKWRSAGFFNKHGLINLYIAIVKDPRFKEGGWDSFKEFMLGPIVLDESILLRKPSQQVSACKTPSDFRKLFRLLGIPNEEWRSTAVLKERGYFSLYSAIVKSRRFEENGWEYFIQWMGDIDEESLDQDAEKLGLSEAIDLLGHQPARLKFYIKISHPELSEEDIDRIVGTSFKRLTTKKTYDYSEFDETLPACEIDDSDIPTETGEQMITVSGIAEVADSVMVYGYRTKRVRTNESGEFQVRIPLKAGGVNEIVFMPVNHEEKTIGQAVSFAVEQTSEPDDIQSLIDLLDEMGKEVLLNIRKDPGRFEYVVHQTEQVLIKKFSKNFEEGRDYIDGLLEKAKSPVVRKVLKKVLDNFRRIDRSTYPNVKKDSPLYFFQKYCVAEIQRRMERGDRGVILANAPGLGKTRTALVAVNGDPATIIAPNNVVSAWGEEAEKCLIDSDVLTLQNIPHKKRMRILEDTEATHVVTNIEFLRGKLGDPRYDLLANDKTIIVHDEAHGLANLGSEQSKGARRLEGKFQLHLTATPFRNPKMMRRMFHNIYPDDLRFSSDAAFTKAFPAHDHEALRKLSIMKDQHVIRFRKEDVLEEMDVNESIETQLHRLPRKEHVPIKEHGEYTLSMEQSEAIYELFKDWSKWTKKYDKYVPKDEISRLDHLRGNQFTFGKLHALRQTANNPNYIGADGIEDNKAKEMMKSVAACLKEGRKVVIFCQYNAQATKYAELLKKYSPSLYTGITSKEGTKKNASGEEMRFRKHEEGGWEMDNRGFPIEDPSGMPMLAMDYERITYQNAPERKVMIATYSAGAVGVTFTAGKAVILDDLPRDITEEIQAEDRIHRIDHEHQTHHSVKYIRMVSKYPKEFLEKMKKVWVKQKKDGTYAETKNEAYARKHDYESAYDLFFEQGTYDEVKIENLLAQRNMFQLLNDGIIDEAEANKEEKSFAIAL